MWTREQADSQGGWDEGDAQSRENCPAVEQLDGAEKKLPGSKKETQVEAELQICAVKTGSLKMAWNVLTWPFIAKPVS